MASSYFDVQPPSKTTSAPTAELLDPHQNGHNEIATSRPKNVTRPSVLTPQLSQLIDTSFEDDSEDSDSDAGSSDEEKDETSQQPKPQVKPKPGERYYSKASTATGQAQQPESKHTTTPSPPDSASAQDSASKEAKSHQPHLARHPRLERFVSLRSSLFSSHIVENLEKMGSPAPQSQPEEQHHGEQHHPKGLSRLVRKGPAGATAGTPKRESLAHRMSNTLRKITSRDVPTLEKIRESEKSEPQHVPATNVAHTHTEKKRQDSAQAEQLTGDGNESDHDFKDEDVDDLVRWVSKRSESGSRKGTKMKPAQLEQPVSPKTPVPEKSDPIDKLALPKGMLESESDNHTPTGAESEGLTPADVDNLVGWVHQKHDGGKHAVTQSSGATSLETKKDEHKPPFNSTKLDTRPKKPSALSTSANEANGDSADGSDDISSTDELEQAAHRSRDPNESVFDIPADQIRLRPSVLRPRPSNPFDVGMEGDIVGGGSHFMQRPTSSTSSQAFFDQPILEDDASDTEDGQKSGMGAAGGASSGGSGLAGKESSIGGDRPTQTPVQTDIKVLPSHDPLLPHEASHQMQAPH